MPEVDPLDVAIASVIGRLIGPPVDYMTAGLQARADFKREQTLERLRRTRASADHAARGRPLNPSDRVAVKALTEASLTDDSLTADYLGGVIAASGPEDDSAVSVLALVSRLSALQLRLHYLIYREARRLLPDSELNLYDASKVPTLRLPMVSDAFPALGTLDGRVVLSAMVLIHREGLISDGAILLDEEATGDERNDSAAMYVSLSSMGAELFLWGHGVHLDDESDRGHADLLFDSALPIDLMTEIPTTPGVVLSDPPSTRRT